MELGRVRGGVGFLFLDDEFGARGMRGGEEEDAQGVGDLLGVEGRPARIRGCVGGGRGRRPARKERRGSRKRLRWMRGWRAGGFFFPRL